MAGEGDQSRWVEWNEAVCTRRNDLNDPENPLLHLVARLHGSGRLCAKYPIRGHSPFDFAFIFLLNNS